MRNFWRHFSFCVRFFHIFILSYEKWSVSRHSLRLSHQCYIIAIVVIIVSYILKNSSAKPVCFHYEIPFGLSTPTRTSADRLVQLFQRSFCKHFDWGERFGQNTSLLRYKQQEIGPQLQNSLHSSIILRPKVGRQLLLRNVISQLVNFWGGSQIRPIY